GGGSGRPAEERGEDALPTVRSDGVAAAEKQPAPASTDVSIGGHIRVKISDSPDLTRGRDSPYHVWSDCRGCPVDDDIGDRIDADAVITSDKRVLLPAVADR